MCHSFALQAKCATYAIPQWKQALSRKLCWKVHWACKLQFFLTLQTRSVDKNLCVEMSTSLPKICFVTMSVYSIPSVTSLSWSEQRRPTTIKNSLCSDWPVAIQPKNNKAQQQVFGYVRELQSLSRSVAITCCEPSRSYPRCRVIPRHGNQRDIQVF